jgi:two-component system alkaline phosphatase synthesis response regulator PhoP
VRRRILIIDDKPEPKLIEGLTVAGYDLEVAAAGTGLANTLSWQPDLVLLGLKAMAEFDLCNEITGRALAPVIILSTRSSSADKIRGFDVGADDYVTRPLVFDELLARIRVVLRRTEGERPPTDAVRFSDVVVDLNRGVVLRSGLRVSFTQKEFEVLRFLICHPGRAFSRDELLRTVWGFHEAPLSRTVDTHIARLRQKLEADPHEPRFIQTVYGLGYAFTP